MSTLGRVYLWMLRFKSVGIIIIACLSGMVLNVYCLYIPACWYITTMYGEYIYIYMYMHVTVVSLNKIMDVIADAAMCSHLWVV